MRRQLAVFIFVFVVFLAAIWAYNQQRLYNQQNILHNAETKAYLTVVLTP